jgi:DinB superfamily
MDLQPWFKQIDNTTEAFQNAFVQLNEQELNWKPDAKTWSVAQNIHHLIVINETYNPVLKSVREGTQNLPWVASVGFMVRFFGNFILKSVEPTRKRKMKTFPLWEPSQSDLPADILQKFVAHQGDLKNLIQANNDLLDKGAIISSPANKNIVYTLARAFDIVITHEQRHLNQALEVNELRIRRAQ